MRRCQVCGEAIADTAKFCRNCGSPVVEEVPEARPARNRPDSEEHTMMLGDEDWLDGADSPRAEPQTPPPQYQRQPVPYNPGPGQGYAPPVPNMWDHTAEFDPKDISDHKVYAMLVYLLGPLGIIIALFKCQSSPFADFHVRQGLKFTALDCLIGIVGVVLGWLFMICLLGAAAEGVGSMFGGSQVNASGGFAIFLGILLALLGIFAFILLIIKIICFFSICAGKAKEPAIVRSFGFMR